MMLSVKIKRIPTIFKKFSWKLNFHDMEILPFMIVLFDTIIITTALSALGMQTISYLTLAVVLVSFLLLFTLNFRHKVLSRYGLRYLLFFLVTLSKYFGLTLITLKLAEKFLLSTKSCNFACIKNYNSR